MNLSPEDISYLEQRRKLLRWWPFVGGAALLILFVGYPYLYFSAPLLANPLYVIEAIKSLSLSQDVLIVSALMLPIAVTLTFFVAGIMLLFLHLALRNERRYQNMLGPTDE